MKKAVYLLLLLFLIYYGCIPIDDTIPPKVPEIETELLKETYYYKDSLSLIITHSDDSGLDTGRLEIFKISGDITSPTAWSVDSLLTLDNGRSFVDTLIFTVPPFVDIGTYKVRITTEDLGGNISQLDTISFFVNTDITPPVFYDLDLGLEKSGDLYLACRTDVISVVGGVNDNIGLDFVGFRLDNGAEVRKLVIEDSINITDVFTDQILIPSDIPNKDTLDFIVFAIDDFDNRQSHIFKILVDCDDEPPGVEIVETTPDINLNNEVNIVQGGDLTLDDVNISDNNFISEVQLYFNLQGDPLVDPVVVPINTGNGPLTVKLQDFAAEGDLVFPISNDVDPGIVYELTIFAIDGEGLTSIPTIIEMTVIEDERPEISLTEVYVSGLNGITPDIDGNYPVIQGDYITFDAKVEDDYRLSALEIRWGIDSEPLNLIINLTEQVDLDLPLNLFTIHDEDDFIIDAGASSGDIYILEITAIDSNNQQVVEILRFKVQ